MLLGKISIFAFTSNECDIYRFYSFIYFTYLVLLIYEHIILQRYFYAFLYCLPRQIVVLDKRFTFMNLCFY